MSLLIVRSQRLSWIQVLNCQNFNQCLKCHKNPGLSLQLSTLIVIKCLKGHRSSGSLFVCQVVKSFVTQWVTRPPIELFWTAKKDNIPFSEAWWPLAFHLAALHNLYRKQNMLKFAYHMYICHINYTSDSITLLKSVHYYQTEEEEKSDDCLRVINRRATKSDF